MFSASRPTRDKVNAFIAAQRDQTFSYPEVGSSRLQQAPPGFTADHHRIQIGQGAETFERAKSAIRQWKMFDMPWLALCWPTTPIEPDATVAVLVSHLGFWSLNPSRVVYVIDDTIEQDAQLKKFGFAYGTLAAHAERGEERFTVEFDPRGQSVWYDIYAFSRPSSLARLAYPFTRSLQKRFARDSKAAMLRAIQSL